MTEARLSKAGSERERALLRMGAQEVPSAESVRAAARVLGLVPRAAIVAYTIGILARAIRWSSSGATMLAPVVAAAGVVAGAYVMAERHSLAVVDTGSITAAPAPAPEHAAAPAPPVAASPVGAPAQLAQQESAPLPAARRVAARAAARTASVPSPASDEVRAQVVLVDRARALVNAGNAVGALRMIDDYHRRFPAGLLSEEASLLRIQAVYARGDRAGAGALVRRFRVDYPRSVYADKVQSMLSDGSK